MTGARGRTGYTVRLLPSGRWQAVVRDPTNPARRISLGTWATQADAEHAGQAAIVDHRRGGWVEPGAGAVTLGEWLDGWLARKAAAGQHGLNHQTSSARIARLHIVPHLGAVPLDQLSSALIRRWYQHLQTERVTAAGTVGLIPAKAYRLLRACLADAARDELITRNPADIRGAGQERSTERPLLDIGQLAALVDAAPDRRKAMLLLAAWGGLRFGELGGLVRSDLSADGRAVTVSTTLIEVGSTMGRKAPKTAAGRRTVVLPAHAAAGVAWHLARFVGPGLSAPVFLGPRGGVLLRRSWSREWAQIKTTAGVAGDVRFHDLRHAAGTMAAQAGATERELQARLGHASAATARRYQHAAALRDAELADRLGLLADRQRTVSARNPGFVGAEGV